jgi:hypothetical protein
MPSKSLAWTLNTTVCLGKISNPRGRATIVFMCSAKEVADFSFLFLISAKEILYYYFWLAMAVCIILVLFKYFRCGFQSRHATGTLIYTGYTRYMKVLSVTRLLSLQRPNSIYRSISINGCTEG